MNTTDLQKLTAFQMLILQYIPAGVQHQNGIPERVSFLEIWYPRYVKISKSYQVGDKIRTIISQVAAGDHIEIPVADKIANQALEVYRSMQDNLRQDAYALYVRDTKTYNEDNRFHKRRKQKEILTAEAFIATLPDLFFI